MTTPCKVICVVSARASYARFREALLHINKLEDIDLGVVLSASAASSRYGDLNSQLESDGLHKLASVQCLVEGSENTMSITTGLATIELASVFSRFNPNLVIVIADRFETLAASIAASYANISVVHVQGGEITGNIDERVRHANTKLSDFHLVSSTKSRARLMSMGEQPDSIYVTGCPSIEIAQQAEHISPTSLQRLVNQVSSGDSFNVEDKYIVCQIHPETENILEIDAMFEKALSAILNTDRKIIIMWPNADAGNSIITKTLQKIRDSHPQGLTFLKNLRAEYFLKLLSLSEFVIGNSSVGIRECSFMGVPTINIGVRQKGRDRGTNVIDVSWDADEIRSAILEIENNRNYYSQRSVIYGDGSASIKITNAIQDIIKNNKFEVNNKAFYDG